MCCDCDHFTPTCMGLVFGDTTIKTVGEAQAFFGKDAIVWEQWDEDRTCEYSPRVGHGPHAPQPSDCLCLVDIKATAHRAAFNYDDLDSEGYYWATLTPRSTRQLPRGFYSVRSGLLGLITGFALCLGAISLAVHLDSRREQEAADQWVATFGRFALPKLDKKNERGDVRVPVYRFSCPDLPPSVGACGSDVSETSY